MPALTPELLITDREKLQELERIIERTVSERASVRVSKVRFSQSEDLDGNDILEVTIYIEKLGRPPKKGFMYDVVTSANSALRESGVTLSPFINARVA